MKYYYRYFFAENEGFVRLLEQVCAGSADRVVRLVFFTDAENNARFNAQWTLLKEQVAQCFGAEEPVWSLVAEKPLFDGDIAVEAHYRRGGSGEVFLYGEVGGTKYITILGDGYKELFVSARSADTGKSPFEQAQNIFATHHAILEAEKMAANSIVRQWNYVEHITAFTGNYQHYQALNDARSDFYSVCPWPCGYPAATGIGTVAGGVCVDIHAVTGVEAVPVNNPLQVAAHSYSHQVIVKEGSKQKSTPKFERAKKLFYQNEPIEYISGTAAIRGENSLADVAIDAQTLTTIENIRALMPPKYAIHSARIYVKLEEEAEGARVVMERELPGVERIFIVADICRPELKVEIEAMAGGSL